MVPVVEQSYPLHIKHMTKADQQRKKQSVDKARVAIMPLLYVSYNLPHAEMYAAVGAGSLHLA